MLSALAALYKVWADRRWGLIATGVVVVAVAGLLCHRPAPTPLPSPVEQLVQRHQLQSAVDSIEITRLERSASAAQVKRDTAVVRAARAASTGDYKAAYALEDTALVAIERKALLLDVALTRSESRAVRADSVIAAVLPLAETREPECRVLHFFACPSRRAVAAAAAGVTAFAILLAPRIRP